MLILKKDSKLNCYISKEEDTDYIYSLLDKIEICMINHKEKTIYFNTDYIGKFPLLEKRIKSKYKDYYISEYCNVVGCPI